MAKLRLGFVTNSSSSSFVIAKKFLSEKQQEAIRRHVYLAKKLNMWDNKWDSAWSIEENECFISGYVSMDNFDMWAFMERIGVKPSNACWSEYYQELPSDDELSELEEDDDWEQYLK